jgi:hypothetical protein
MWISWSSLFRVDALNVYSKRRTFSYCFGMSGTWLENLEETAVTRDACLSVASCEIGRCRNPESAEWRWRKSLSVYNVEWVETSWITCCGSKRKSPQGSTRTMDMHWHVCVLFGFTSLYLLSITNRAAAVLALERKTCLKTIFLCETSATYSYRTLWESFKVQTFIAETEGNGFNQGI